MICKFEAGDECRTHSGKDACIYEVRDDVIHGAVFDAGEWVLVCWSLDGKARELPEGFDLMPPPREIWMWQWARGGWGDGVFWSEKECLNHFNGKSGHPVKFIEEIKDE